MISKTLGSKFEENIKSVKFLKVFNHIINSRSAFKLTTYMYLVEGHKKWLTHALDYDDIVKCKNT